MNDPEVIMSGSPSTPVADDGGQRQRGWVGSMPHSLIAAQPCILHPEPCIWVGGRIQHPSGTATGTAGRCTHTVREYTGPSLV